MKNLQDLTPADLLSAYSGKAGKCMCGCAGEHYYRAETRAAAGADRGYAIGDEEVNDAMVTRVLRIIQANEDCLDNDGDPAYVSATVGKRAYIAYLVPAQVQS